MKVIFLDMDGVIASTRAHLVNPRAEPSTSVSEEELSLAHDKRWIDPIALAMLKRLQKAADAQIVLSSAWRKIRTKEHMETLLGIKFHDDWRTISTAKGFRGDEVKEWMSRHPEVTHHVILDDDSDFHEDQNHVKCDCYDGWGFHGYFQAETFLGVNDG